MKKVKGHLRSLGSSRILLELTVMDGEVGSEVTAVPQRSDTANKNQKQEMQLESPSKNI